MVATNEAEVRCLRYSFDKAKDAVISIASEQEKRFGALFDQLYELLEADNEGNPDWADFQENHPEEFLDSFFKTLDVKREDLGDLTTESLRELFELSETNMPNMYNFDLLRKALGEMSTENERIADEKALERKRGNSFFGRLMGSKKAKKKTSKKAEAKKVEPKAEPVAATEGEN